MKKHLECSGVYVYDDFCTEDECERIMMAMDFMANHSEKTNLSKGEPLHSAKFFNLWANSKVRDSDEYLLLADVRLRMLTLAQKLYEKQDGVKIYNESTNFATLANDAMEYHCDNVKRLQKEPYLNKQDYPSARDHGYGVKAPKLGFTDPWQPNYGDEWIPNHTPTRSHTLVLYLNDDFNGGETRFPTLGVDVTPKTGRITCFRANGNHEHGVRFCDGGVRYTIAGWMCFDSEKNEDKGISNFDDTYRPYSVT